MGIYKNLCLGYCVSILFESILFPRYLHLHFEGHPVEATRTGYRFPLPEGHHLELPKVDSDPQKRDFDFNKLTLSSMRACSYDYSTGPCSESDILRYCTKVESLLEEVEGIDKEMLSEDQLVDHTLIISELKLELLQWRTIEIYKKDPLFYLPLNSILYLLPAWGPEGGSEDDRDCLSHPGVVSMSVCEKLVALLSRLRAIPNTLVQAHRNLTKPVKLFVETALDICTPFCLFLAETLPLLCNSLISSDKSGLAFGSLSLEIELAASIAAKSIQKYRTFLQEDVLPRASESLGVGKEVYEKILEYSHFSTSSDQLLALGEEQFAKVKADLESLAAEIDSIKTWKEITKDVIQPMHPTAEGLLQAYMSEIKRSRDHMISHNLVSDIPEEEKIIGFSTPKFLIPFSPVGDYLNPSPFAGMGQSSSSKKIPRIGHLMLHSIEAQMLSKSEEMELLRGHDYTWISVVCPHESYPGHHIQALRAQDHPRILRRYYESILFYEGWGLYTEELAYETGFFNRDLTYQVEGGTEMKTLPADAYAKLARLTQLRLRLWRAARIILDVKLNTGKFSFEDCREFLHREVMFNSGASKGEAFMYASRPGYAPCYISGFTMIMKLRSEKQACTEREFKLKDFHNEVLSKGCIPFKLL